MSSLFRRTPAGFQMTFSNGYTVSVQWGEVNYCQNRNLEDSEYSQDAEVAIIRPDGSWMPLDLFDEGRICEGYLSTDKVLKYIQLAQGLPRP